jgi:hypothetical protein
VPGIAGFVAWYLRHLSPADVDHHDGLSRAAALLVETHRARFDAVWTAVDDRRLPDGGFRPWARTTLRSHLEGWRAEWRVSDRWVDRLGSYLLLPSLAVLSLAGR